MTTPASVFDRQIDIITPYWGDNERKDDPAVYAQLKDLELALTGRHPYKLLARHYQVIAQKGGAHRSPTFFGNLDFKT